MDWKKLRLFSRELTGFLLLALLLLGGLVSSSLLCRHHLALANQLENAAWYALEGSWAQAVSTVSGASGNWQQHWNLCAVFADHTPMEEIDDQFACLSIRASTRDAEEFASGCNVLAQKLQAMADAQRLSWWNLF